MSKDFINEVVENVKPTKKINSFELINRANQITDEFAEGEWTPELQAEFDATEQNAKDKIESIFYVIKSVEAKEALIKEEIDRLQSKRKNLENSASRVKQMACKIIDAFSTDGKFKTENLNSTLVSLNVVNQDETIFPDIVKSIITRAVNNVDTLTDDERSCFSFGINIKDLSAHMLNELMRVLKDEFDAVMPFVDINAKFDSKKAKGLMEFNFGQNGSHDIDIEGISIGVSKHVRYS